jgi:hypothetical protein
MVFVNDPELAEGLIDKIAGEARANLSQERFESLKMVMLNKNFKTFNTVWTNYSPLSDKANS